MENLIAKASHLIEALPYIRRFYGKKFVIKCGGAAMAESSQQMRSMMQDIALLHFCGIRPIIVHGGGPEITAMCKDLDIPVLFAHGQRVTDSKTMEIVQMVLLGKTNRALVTALNQYGVKGVGLSGQDAAFIHTQKMANAHAEDLGFVGEITSIDTTLISTLLTANFVPIIAPIGSDNQGQTYNINADIAAGALAGALGAEKLVILSDVNGLYADVNDPNTRIPTLDSTTLATWLAEKRFAGGMIPKLQACLTALEAGVPGTHILDGKMPHSLLLEIFTDAGIGTMITA